MRLRSGYENKKARVDMLPLIDVVFLLLVFFIYAMLSMVLHRGMAVNLPSAASATAENLDYVAVTITKDNQLMVDRVPVELDEIPGAVRAHLEASETPSQIFIECDEQADAGLAIRVLDRLRWAGIEEVLFASRNEPR